MSADGERAEKPPCEDDAGLESRSLEHGIELNTLNGHGCQSRQGSGGCEFVTCNPLAERPLRRFRGK